MELQSDEDRTIWFDGYVKTYLERDLRALSSKSALPDFPRLKRAACLRMAQLVNQTELCRDVALLQLSVHRYLNLLETFYLLVRLPAVAVNCTRHLIKSPKLYWGDTGVAMHLTQEDELRGAHLGNLVLQDLLAWRDSRIDQVELFYWRTTILEEVDFVVETADSLLPIEVRTTRRPCFREAVHLRTFTIEYGERSRPGFLLHDGDLLDWITPDVLGVPLWKVL